MKKPSLPLFNTLKILTIHDIFKMEILKFVFDTLRKTNPSQFHAYFKYSTSNINTASIREKKLFLPSIRTTTYGIKSIKYNGALLWNNTSLTIPNLTQSRKSYIVKFKNQCIQTYLLN